MTARQYERRKRFLKMKDRQKTLKRAEKLLPRVAKVVDEVYRELEAPARGYW
jgi:hypothetical protein